jgi:Cupredoxin-like domain
VPKFGRMVFGNLTHVNLTCVNLTCAKLALVVLGLVFAADARAEDDPVFRIEFHDGTVTPLRIQVPANRRFKIELRNSGATPAEFESNELRKEKVLAPDSTSVLVFRTLDPGEYPFFDDFHPDAPKAVLVAK